MKDREYTVYAEVHGGDLRDVVLTNKYHGYKKAKLIIPEPRIEVTPTTIRKALDNVDEKTTWKTEDLIKELFGKLDD